MQDQIVPKLGQDEHGAFLCLTKMGVTGETDRSFWRFNGEYWSTVEEGDQLTEDHKLRLTTQFRDDARMMFCDLALPPESSVELTSEHEGLTPEQSEAEKRFLVEDHLNDMRAIVAKALDVKLPE